MLSTDIRLKRPPAGRVGTSCYFLPYLLRYLLRYQDTSTPLENPHRGSGWWTAQKICAGYKNAEAATTGQTTYIHQTNSPSPILIPPDTPQLCLSW